MTKKEFIWLGIRAVGVYWLLMVLYHLFQLIWITGYWVLLKIRGVNPGSYSLTWLNNLMNFPVPLLFAIYFLFFGTLIYKLVDHCVRSRPEDLSRPNGYCYSEIVVRFLGLNVVYMMVNVAIFLPLRTGLNSALMVYLNPSAGTPSGVFRTALGYYFSAQALSTLVLYLIAALFFGWYFLKRGQLFINLLNRLWQKAAADKSPVNPI